jgi:hypothetical protein
VGIEGVNTGSNPVGATHIGEQHARVAAGRPEAVATAVGLAEGLTGHATAVEHALEQKPGLGPARRSVVGSN